MPEYCSNECESEATEYFINDEGEKTHLCHTCAVAFRWGQVHPKNETFFIEDDEDIENV